MTMCSFIVVSALQVMLSMRRRKFAKRDMVRVYRLISRGQGYNSHCSMKVVRASLGFGDEEGLHAFGADGDYVVLILQDSFYR